MIESRGGGLTGELGEAPSARMLVCTQEHERTQRETTGGGKIVVKLRHLVVLAVLLLTVALAACGGEASNTGGGVPRIGVIGTTGSLNPFSARLQGEYNTYANIYPRLVGDNLPTLAYEPELARTWSSTPDQRTWTFELKPGAKWSDGRPITAKDVAFTLNMVVKYQNGPTASWSGYVTFLKRAEATDARTVVLRYGQPLYTAPAQAGHMIIVPQHVWERHATSGKALNNFANQPAAGRPVVSGGPFILTEQKKDRVEIFKRNPGYYGRQPAISGFGVRYFANPDAAASALRQGDIDALQQVPPTVAGSLKSAGFTVSTIGQIDFPGLSINTNPAKRDNRELLDARVRKAFAHAIDRNKIARLAYAGYADPGSTIVPPVIGNWHDSQLAPLPFDVAAANGILDKAGFKRGAGGTRMANGHPMSYQVLIQPKDKRTFDVLQSGFEEIGVKLSPRALDPQAQFQAITAPDNKYLNYDLAIRGWTSGGYDPDFGLSGFACFAQGIFSPAGYCDPTYDKLYRAQKVAPRTQRVRLVHRMQKMIHDQRVYVVLVYPQQIDAWSKRWTGFKQTPRGVFSNLTPDTLTSVHKTG